MSNLQPMVWSARNDEHRFAIHPDAHAAELLGRQLHESVRDGGRSLFHNGAESTQHLLRLFSRWDSMLRYDHCALTPDEQWMHLCNVLDRAYWGGRRSWAQSPMAWRQTSGTIVMLLRDIRQATMTLQELQTIPSVMIPRDRLVSLNCFLVGIRDAAMSS